MKVDGLIIVVTGTPGTGKTTFANELSKAIPGSKLVELNDVVEQFKLYSGTDEMGSRIVEIKELNNRIGKVIKGKGAGANLIIVGHLAPELRIRQDITVVLRASLKELISRLEERGYSKEKVRENLVSESIDYCGARSVEQCRETYEIETDTERKEMISYIKDRALGIEAKAPIAKEIDKMGELLELVTEGNRYNL